MRIALCVEYDGANFHGWQRQPSTRTVQGCLETAVSEIACHPTHVFCAGRTDTGVHATKQIIHFDSDTKRDTRNWMYGVLRYLPSDISIRWAYEVPDNFHARFSAIKRRYRFLIYNSPVRPSIYASGLTWHYSPLDSSKMSAACEHLKGEHDFTSYRASSCQAHSPVRTVYDLSVTQKNELIMIDITANAFLHHMVRNIAGVLLAIGDGRQDVDWSKDVLEAKNRSLGGITAPPYGLYLVDVQYPEEFDLPDSPLGPLIIN